MSIAEYQTCSSCTILLSRFFVNLSSGFIYFDGDDDDGGDDSDGDSDDDDGSISLLLVVLFIPVSYTHLTLPTILLV